MDAVAGVRVGIVQPLQHPEAALCLAVVKVDGNGVAACLQGVQVGALQGDNVLLDGVAAVADALAVYGHAHELGSVAADGEAQGLGALQIPLAAVTLGDGVFRSLGCFLNGEGDADRSGVAAVLNGGDDCVSGAGLVVILEAQGVILPGGENGVLHGDGDLGLDGLAVKDEFRLVQLDVAFFQLGGVRLLFHNGKGNFHFALVAGSGNAGDGHGGGADFHIVGKVQCVVLVQSQQSILYPNGDVGADLLAGVLILGVLQSDVVLRQGNDLPGRILRPDGERCCQHQGQRQGHAQTALNQGCAHIRVPPWVCRGPRLRSKGIIT